MGPIEGGVDTSERGDGVRGSDSTSTSIRSTEELAEGEDIVVEALRSRYGGRPIKGSAWVALRAPRT